MQDCDFKDVTSANTFFARDGAYVGAAGNSGAPDLETVYTFPDKAALPVGPASPVPSGQVQPLRPDDDAWLTIRDVRPPPPPTPPPLIPPLLCLGPQLLPRHPPELL